MLHSQDFYIGAEVKFIKTFDAEYPMEIWFSSIGCPPLPPGTTGKVVDVKPNRILVEVLNPEINSPSVICIYDINHKSNRKNNRLDCVELLKNED